MRVRGAVGPTPCDARNGVVEFGPENSKHEGGAGPVN